MTAAPCVSAYHHDPDVARREELLECLRRNLANPAASEVHVLLEDGVEPEVESPKLRLVPHGRRVTYGDLFAYANERLAGRRVVVANADIYFDESLARLGGCDLDGRLLCVSRWDVEADRSARLFEHAESQDAWIFDAPIREFPCDFHLGLPGCENRLAWEAAQAGLDVSNPARALRAYHLHLSGIRRYSEDQRIHGETKSLPPGFLGPAVDAARATVAFDETMGYGIAEFDLGVSSHVNVHCPFTSIPEQLRGQRYTQVVASAVSPVAVRFLTPGKLYVLVGDDWDGYHVAREWLCDAGYDERLPRVETASGGGFEVWSLLGDAGDRIEIPTQVMLVADRLVKDEVAP